MVIRDEEGIDIDTFIYTEMNCLSYFKKDSKRNIIVIMEKIYDKPSISFRITEEHFCKYIYEFVNKKIRIANEANQAEILIQRRNIIQKIRENNSVYKEVYEKHPNLFSTEWLDSIFFENSSELR